MLRILNKVLQDKQIKEREIWQAIISYKPQILADKCFLQKNLCTKTCFNLNFLT